MTGAVAGVAAVAAPTTSAGSTRTHGASAATRLECKQHLSDTLVSQGRCNHYRHIAVVNMMNRRIVYGENIAMPN